MFIYIDRYCRYIQYWYKSLEQSWKAIRINFTFGGLCVELLQRQKIRAAGANETLMKVGHGGGGAKSDAQGELKCKWSLYYEHKSFWTCSAQKDLTGLGHEI